MHEKLFYSSHAVLYEHLVVGDEHLGIFVKMILLDNK